MNGGHRSTVRTLLCGSKNKGSIPFGHPNERSLILQGSFLIPYRGLNWYNVFMESETKNCQNCKKDFIIEPDDFGFYEKIKVPPPSLCPECRRINRFGQFLRVPKFFKKKCSAPGHNEEVVTIYPPDSPHKIYDFDFYQSDNWDPVSFGREIDINKSFFEQFKEFFFDIPHLPLERDPNAVNCEYTLGGRNGKNDYYTASAYGTTDSQYCVDARFCRDVFDCNLVASCELCYEMVGSNKCNNCFFVDYSENCVDSSFLYDCKNCLNCYFSYNLRNKSYVFENEQLTKEEYENKIKEINFGDRDEIKKIKNNFKKFIKNALRRNVYNINTINSIGDQLIEARNCSNVFRSTKVENIKYSDICLSSKDSMDVLGSADSENNYETIIVLGSNNKFSMYCRVLESSEFCIECRNCTNCFGCIGLRNKKFHIFNKPYSEESYLQKISKIKEKMIEKGEYGNFFPLKMGLVPYQSSSGQIFFPIDKKMAEKLQINWYLEPKSFFEEEKSLYKESLPVSIKEVQDDILEKIIICEESGKPYRLTQREIEFYRRMNLPIPSRSPWQRILDRLKREHGLILYPFICPKCKESYVSIYNEKEQIEYKIYCEKCYLRELY